MISAHEVGRVTRFLAMADFSGERPLVRPAGLRSDIAHDRSRLTPTRYLPSLTQASIVLLLL